MCEHVFVRISNADRASRRFLLLSINYQQYNFSSQALTIQKRSYREIVIQPKISVEAGLEAVTSWTHGNGKEMLYKFNNSCFLIIQFQHKRVNLLKNLRAFIAPAANQIATLRNTFAHPHGFSSGIFASLAEQQI